MGSIVCLEKYDIIQNGDRKIDLEVMEEGGPGGGMVFILKWKPSFYLVYALLSILRLMERENSSFRAIPNFSTPPPSPTR